MSLDTRHIKAMELVSLDFNLGLALGAPGAIQVGDHFGDAWAICCAVPEKIMLGSRQCHAGMCLSLGR